MSEIVLSRNIPDWWATEYGKRALEGLSVVIVQPADSELDPSDSRFIEGLKAGDAFQPSTKRIWPADHGLLLTPCYTTAKYVGLVQSDCGVRIDSDISVHSPLVSGSTMDRLPNGDMLVRDDYYFCLIIDDTDSFEPAVIPMKSASIPMKSASWMVSRNWKTKMAMLKVQDPRTGDRATPPIIETIWRLRSIREECERGISYRWDLAEFVCLSKDNSCYLAAKKYRSEIIENLSEGIGNQRITN